MSPKLWSDEDRLFIPRMGGWTINFKHVARKFGWVKTPPAKVKAVDADVVEESAENQEARLRRSVRRSRFEDS